MPNPTPFDDGVLYDQILGDLDYGLDFYLRLAREAAGPVLDVCCGTGRILLPSLAAGVDIEGLDLYESMLEQLRAKAATRGLSPRLHRADMSDFQLPRKFALIMIPFNAIIHNLTVEAQLRTLELCREHLVPGGLLVFDTFFPAPEIVNVPAQTRVLEGEKLDAETGLTIRVYDSRTFDRVRQTQHSIMDIEFVDPSGTVVRSEQSEISSRWIYKNEMELLLRLARFSRWEICGDYDRRPLERETDALIVLAWTG